MGCYQMYVVFFRKKSLLQRIIKHSIKIHVWDASVFTVLAFCTSYNLNAEKMLEIYQQLLKSVNKWFESDNESKIQQEDNETIETPHSVTAYLCMKSRNDIRFWINLHNRLMQIQLKMCGPSLRGSCFKESLCSI